MSPIEAFEEAIKQANGKSSAILIERCEKSETYPHGIKPVEYIAPDEIVVVGLPGTVSRKESLKACNGILKRITNFIQTNPKLKDIKVRPVMAVTDFGNYFDKEMAKHLLLLEKNDKKSAEKMLHSLPLIEQQEYLTPNYVKDIYNLVLKNRLTSPRNNARLSPIDAAKNISRTIFVPYCWGGYTILKIEDYINQQMALSRYHVSERRFILSQMLSVCFSPSCPIGTNRSRMVSFSSATDLLTKHNNYAKEYLNMSYLGCPDFGYLWLDSKDGNIFYCTQYNKNGVEGNPRKIVLHKIGNTEDLFPTRQQNNNEPHLGEHDFLGFEPNELMSNAAKKIQYYAQNILINGIKHAANQPFQGYKKLPNTRMLAAATPKDHWNLFQAYRLGLALQLNINDFGKENIMKKSFAANIQTVSLD